jgi:protein KRI1
MAKKEHVEVVSDPETDDYDSESDVTEDEDGLDLTPALDAAILRTLGKIRRGEGVYNAEKVLEEELAQAEAEAIKRGVNVKKVKKEQAKPYLLADHHRAALLSGQVNEPEDDDPNGERAPPMTYAQEERKMRKDAIEAFKNFGGDGAEDDEDDFAPVKREQDEDEQDEADAGYRQFLLEMGGGEDEVRRLLGMGDQPVSHVRDVQDEAEASQAGEEKKKESEKKKQKRLAKKRQDDDSFLME